MNFESPSFLALFGGLAGLWVVLAGWALVRGLTMQREAAAATRRVAQLAAMIEASPSFPLLVRPDGKLEGVGDVALLFGTDQLPPTIAELPVGTGSGFPEKLVQDLHDAIALAQRTAQPFSMVLRSQDRTRSVDIRGTPAPAQLRAPGGALLWVSDNSTSERDLNRIRQQRADAVAAFEAISGLIEAAPFPMWFRDRSMTLMLVNSAYVAATEAENAQEVVARQIELIEPSGGVSARDAAMAAHDAVEAQSRLIPVTVAGQRRMMVVSDVPIEDVGVAGYALDRQELEDTRAEYRRFSDARRSMLDEMSAAVAEFAPDRTLRFVNRPFLRLFMLDPEWASSAPAFERLLDRLRDNGRTPEVRDFPGWRAERRGWFALSELVEESWHLRDGSHLRAVAQPTPDGGLLLIFEDQTEQIRLASARDTLLRVRTATFDNLFEAVAVFAPDGRLQMWNQRFRRLWELNEEYLTSYPRLDQLLGRVADKLADPRQQSVLRQMVVGATGEREQRNGRIAFADGRQFDFAAIPLPDGNALFTLIDVTDSQKIERALRDRATALEAADRIKADFLSRISYDLRTPLTSIGGFAEMLGSGLAGELSDQAKSYVQAILDSTEALGQQIDTVLDLSQSEAGAMPLERRSLDLRALIFDAANAVKQQCQEAGVALRVDVAEDIGRVDGDAKRLRQALDQALTHALAGFADAQWQPADGRSIFIFADGQPDTVRIIVKDNGSGKEIGGASAIGLALTRQLAAAHGGSFEHETREGEGAMVAIFLPR